MRSLIARNWKMHGMGPQLGEIDAIAAAVHAMPPPADVLICVPARLLARHPVLDWPWACPSAGG